MFFSCHVGISLLHNLTTGQIWMKISFSVCLFPQQMRNNLNLPSHWGILIAFLYMCKWHPGTNQHTVRSSYSLWAFSVRQNCSCFLPLLSCLLPSTLQICTLWMCALLITQRQHSQGTTHSQNSKKGNPWRYSLLFLLNDCRFLPLSVFLLSLHKGVFCTVFCGLRLRQLALSSQAFHADLDWAHICWQ